MEKMGSGIGNEIASTTTMVKSDSDSENDKGQPNMPIGGGSNTEETSGESVMENSEDNIALATAYTDHITEETKEIIYHKYDTIDETGSTHINIYAEEAVYDYPNHHINKEDMVYADPKKETRE